MTDSPVPIWHCANIITLALEGLFKDVQVPAVPGKEEPRKMYLEERVIYHWISTVLILSVPDDSGPCVCMSDLWKRTSIS